MGYSCYCCHNNIQDKNYNENKRIDFFYLNKEKLYNNTIKRSITENETNDFKDCSIKENESEEDNEKYNDLLKKIELEKKRKI